MAPRKNEAVTGTTDPDSATAGSAEAPRGKGPADGPPPPAGPPAPQGARLARTTSAVLAGLASQAVILTAVLFYFGWARAKATYGYFGVDISVLDFSASDYVLRSVSAAFPLLVAIGLAGLAAMIVHERLRPQLGDRAGTADRLARAVTWAGGALIAAGLVLAIALTGPGGSDFPGPAILLIGCALWGLQ